MKTRNGWSATLGIPVLGSVGLAILVALALLPNRTTAIDASDVRLAAAGKEIYAGYCSFCHGANLEGQPNWRERLPHGRMPAPPHDASGHTWHHADAMLFDIVKEGLVPGKYAPPGYQSDMPGFGSTLSDAEIRAVLAYIKSTWPEQIRARQSEVSRRHRAP